MDEIKYHNVKTGEDSTFRYYWMIRPYSSTNQKFKISINVIPTVLATQDRRLPNYPDIVEILKQFDGEIHEFGVYIYFDKTDNDSTIVDKIHKYAETLEKAGIPFRQSIDTSLGIPSLDYGQKYLEYTTSVNGIGIQDLFVVMSRGNPNITDDLMRAIPIKTDEDFNPNKDTEVHVDNILNGIVRHFHKLMEKSKRIEQTTNKIMEAFHSVPTSHETYTSENSSEYEDFQKHWI